MDWMPHAIREGILTVLLISGPLVVLAAGLGLTIGVLQAATQIQEQTLGSAVKILGIFLALIIFGIFIFQYMQEYSKAALNKAFRLVPTLESSPLPPREVKRKRNEQEEIRQNNLPYAFSPPSSSSFSSGGPNLSAFGGLANEPQVVPINQGASQQIPTLPSLSGPVTPSPDTPNFQTQELATPTSNQAQAPAVVEPQIPEPRTAEPAPSSSSATPTQTAPTTAPSQAVPAPSPTPTASQTREETTTPPATVPTGPSSKEKRAEKRRERRSSLNNLINKIQDSIDTVKEE